MYVVIVAVAMWLLFPVTTRAQLDPTAPLPARVLSVFVPVLDADLGPVSASSELPGSGRLFHTATTWTEGTEPGSLDNPVSVVPPETRGFILVAGGAAVCPNGNLQGVASAVAYGPFVDALVTTFPSVDPGPMTTSRILHAAVLLTAPLPGPLPGSFLTDGRVLVAGGQSNPGLHNALASAEVYDPATHAFLATGDMTTPRVTHRAVRLLDGRVLIVGGVMANPADPGCQEPPPDPCSGTPAPSCSGLALASAEIFDPLTNAFSATGSMATPRGVGHSATLLSDGRVLVAGGITNPPGGPLVEGALYPALATTELYDPASGTFSPGPPMLAARANHTATRLFHVDAPSAICQSSPAFCVAVSSIFPARVLVAGGSAQAGLNEIFAGALGSAETYHPSTGSFSPDGPMATPRTLHAAELLPHGKILVTGGAIDDAVTITGTAELFDPGQGSSSFDFLLPAGAGTFVPTNAPMTTARGGHTVSLIPTIPRGTAVVIGGATAVGPTTTVETYLP